jgi:hypothetical protein
VALTLFSFLWAASSLFHVASYRQWTGAPLIIVTSALVLLRPSSTAALFTLAAAHLAQTAWESPFVPNHQLFGALVNGAFVAGIAVLALQRRGRAARVDRGELFEAIAPAVRLALLVLYFFAFLHKLNTDWFDLEVSCGAELYAAVRQQVPFLPGSAPWNRLAVYGSLAIEAIIPLLLTFARTRHVGILTGAGFHWLLALHPFHAFYNFSSMLFALFMLFVAPSVVHAAFGGARERRIRWMSWSFAALFGVCYLVNRVGVDTGSAPTDVFIYLFALGALLLAAGFLLPLRGRAWGAAAAGAFRLPRPFLAALPLLVFLNGLTPYLGLKTEGAWAMFSNLRTENGRSNHLFVPVSIQLFDYQRDLVQVTRSSDNFLQAVARRRQLVPYFEVRRRAQVIVRYDRNGVTYGYGRVADDPAFFPVSLVEAKLLRFRPVTPGTRQTCLH